MLSKYIFLFVIIPLYYLLISSYIKHTHTYTNSYTHTLINSIRRKKNIINSNTYKSQTMYDTISRTASSVTLHANPRNLEVGDLGSLNFPKVPMHIYTCRYISYIRTHTAATSMHARTYAYTYTHISHIDTC